MRYSSSSIPEIEILELEYTNVVHKMCKGLKREERREVLGRWEGEGEGGGGGTSGDVAILCADRGQ